MRDREDVNFHNFHSAHQLVDVFKGEPCAGPRKEWDSTIASLLTVASIVVAALTALLAESRLLGGSARHC